ncbi:TraB/GumN family protein [Exilibacterium tricleocarpae]|uniref:TraB/GumN family protein n=1 Tax=Exilibacterium tricleocarpae TaxID=2591008 RepID=A0A545T895_9GAMM|nr:TraB/GumN family protein [Exilibacterium tricleocarpae]TQV73442.1 TraB/GumN family protein [Exilibacterium tricleocarpae]
MTPISRESLSRPVPCWPLTRATAVISLLFVWVLSPPVVAATDVSPLLWRVSSQTSAGQVYLLGSIHFGHPSLYPLPPPVMDAYHDAEALAVELDLEAVDPHHAARLMQAQGRYPAGVTLRDTLGPPTWQRLRQVCEDLGVDVERFLQVKPWLVAVQLVSLQMLQTDYRKELGVDRHFLRLARGEKPILELETLEEQLAIFGQFSDREQYVFLKQTLDAHERGQAHLDIIAAGWRAGDREALAATVLAAFDSEDVGARLYRLVFSERNARMASAAVGFLARNERVFMVAGVGHMLGEEGIVARLDRAGYRVEQVSPGG